MIGKWSYGKETDYFGGLSLESKCHKSTRRHWEHKNPRQEEDVDVDIVSVMDQSILNMGLS